jgi:low molecular weight protein-tyrosine phosphatase
MKALIDRLRGVRPEAEPAEPPVYCVLFVCMGNICRSPTAEGVFRKRVGERLPELTIEIDSAGTHAYHVGEAPDPRACRAAERRGIDIGGLQARKVVERDFERFDLVLAMDELNRAVLFDLCPEDLRHKVRLLLDFAPQLGRADVPDPYYGGANGFEYVLDLVEEAATGVIEHVRRAVEGRASR